MNESCHTWMSHVTHEWVMSHMHESCHTWMSHVTHEWVMSHMNESCHTWMGHVMHEWIMSHMNESCLTWMSHVICDINFMLPPPFCYVSPSWQSRLDRIRIIWRDRSPWLPTILAWGRMRSWLQIRGSPVLLWRHLFIWVLIHTSSWQNESRHRSTCHGSPVILWRHLCIWVRGEKSHVTEVFVLSWQSSTSVTWLIYMSSWQNESHHRSTCHGSPVLLWCVYNNDYCTIFLSIVT